MCCCRAFCVPETFWKLEKTINRNLGFTVTRKVACWGSSTSCKPPTSDTRYPAVHIGLHLILPEVWPYEEEEGKGQELKPLYSRSGISSVAEAQHVYCRHPNAPCKQPLSLTIRTFPGRDSSTHCILPSLPRMALTESGRRRLHSGTCNTYPLWLRYWMELN